MADRSKERGGYLMLGWALHPEIVHHWCRASGRRWRQVGWLARGTAGDCTPAVRDVEARCVARMEE